MDKRIANNIIVGIFVTAAFAGFVFVLFNIGYGGLLAKQFTLYGRFQHVNGLHMGSEVSLSGLRIGVVRSIKVSDNANGEMITELAIVKEFQDKLRKDTVATIKTQGVLGDKYIELTVGSKDAPSLQNGDLLVTNEPEDLMTKGGKAVEGISRQFGHGSDFESLLKNLAKTSENLNFLTTEIRNNRSVGHEIAYGKSGERLGQAIDHLEGILRKINAGEGTLGALVNDPSVYEDLRAVMGGAKRSNVLRLFVKDFMDTGRAAETKKKE